MSWVGADADQVFGEEKRTDGDRAAGGVQRWSDRDHHYDHGAGVEGAGRAEHRSAHSVGACLPELRSQLYLRRDLLEQSPSHAAHVRGNDRWDSMGEPPLAFLAVDHSVCD